MATYRTLDLKLPVAQPPTTQNMESSLVPHFVLPRALVNSKYEELSSSKINRTKLARISVVLRKYLAYGVYDC